ncbi:hypothetical protein AK812_SmicGene45213 [Symbiodinium microadriaticum]|uniref:Uncharacterized protein n=1 Tax=Symbiodinium microadriaticum TaxID=2951 RepID=A0A1Q9BWN8_SYMMI|nr:hypothetical protein AK812_SmicGene45213 [Symbiodinium microadriaticum]
MNRAQVLADELADLKRRRAEKRAQNRALAKQEKALRKRRSRLMQVLVMPRLLRLTALRLRVLNKKALTMLTIMVLLTRRPVRFMWLPRKKALVVLAIWTVLLRFLAQCLWLPSQQEALVATLTWSVPVVQAVAGRGCLSVFVVGPELVGGAEEALAEAGEEA